MTGAEVRFVLSGSGHIAGVVNPPVLGKYQFWTNPDMSKPTLEEWLAGAEETAGQLVARLGRLAEGALGPAGAGARAGRPARRHRAGAGLLRQGALRRAGRRGARPSRRWPLTGPPASLRRRGSRHGAQERVERRAHGAGPALGPRCGLLSRPDGYAAVSMRQIAAEVGVQAGALYL